MLLLILACQAPTETRAPASTACGAVAPSLGAPALHFSGPRPRNLLVLSIDTLRRDRTTRYNASVHTPFLSELMENSVVLDDMRSCANWTYPAMTCVMTGQSTLEMGVEPMIPENIATTQMLPPGQETLATWLSAAGWQTALITTSVIFSEANPLTNGFQQYLSGERQPANWLVDQGLQWPYPPDPWYLHLHFVDPHTPYVPPERYQGDLVGVNLDPYDPRTDSGLAHIRKETMDLPEEQRQQIIANLDTLYQGEIAFVDDELARLWAGLDAAGVLDSTLVMVISDHGEQLFEHGSFSHDRSLHTEEAMVIGAFWSKNLDPLAFSAPVSQPDLAPTILDVFGLPLPTQMTGQVIGREGPDRVRRSSAVDEAGRPVQAVERNGLRLLYHWTGERHFYDYRRDPTESADLYDSENPDVRCLWDFLRPDLEWENVTVAGGPPVRPE